MANNLCDKSIWEQLINEDYEKNDNFNKDELNRKQDDLDHSIFSEESDAEFDWKETITEQHFEEYYKNQRLSNEIQIKNESIFESKTVENEQNQYDETQPVAGPTNTSNVDTIEQFWDILFSIEIIQIIVTETNKRIENACAQSVSKDKVKTFYYHTDVNEIRAYIGVLYYAGLWKTSYIEDTRLWDKKNGITLYRCVFTRHRFSFLTSCLNFSYKDSTNTTDDFAPVREIWDIFFRNCQHNYNPSDKCTVSEHLLNFHGSCLYRATTKSKPDKYELKLVTLNDAETLYLINAILYLGKTNVKAKDESISEYFFPEVTTPIHGTSRTVTCINTFSNCDETKEGINHFKKLCHLYSVARKTNKWHIQVFYGMLDMAIFNARILWKCKLRATNSNEKSTAIICLEKMYMYLIKPYLTHRYYTQTLRKDLKISIAGILMKKVSCGQPHRKVQLKKRQRCAMCTRKEDRKTKEACSSCERPICDHHRLYFCTDCAGS